MTITISTELRDKIIAELQKYPAQVYWDGNDEFENSQIVEALEKSPDDPLLHIEENLASANDYWCDLEMFHIEEALKSFQDELEEELDDDDLDIKGLAREMRDELIEYVTVDTNIKSLLRGDVPVRIQMYSNYDCINSHWFEAMAGGGYYMPESYMADVIKMLHLNPADVKKKFEKHGVLCHGSWPNKKTNPVISIDDFWTEEENRSCPATLLTFLATVDQYELLEHGIKDATIIIPKGNTVGFYSSWEGGGSMCEAPLLRDVEITLNKGYDKSGYLTFGMQIDAGGGSYSMKRVFGVGDSFFGSNIKFKTIKTKTNGKAVVQK